MRIFRIARTEIPEGRALRPDSVYVWEQRITDTQTVSRTTGMRANKEYIVRVYEYPNDYGVIAFYGRIGGTLQSDYKRTALSRGVAIQYATNVINNKLGDPSKNYTRDDPYEGTQIPGVDANYEPPRREPQAQPANQPYRVTRENFNDLRAAIRNTAERARQVSIIANDEDDNNVITCYIHANNDGSYSVSSNYFASPIPEKYDNIHQASELIVRSFEKVVMGNKEVDPKRMEQQEPIEENLVAPKAEDDLEELIGERKMQLTKIAQPVGYGHSDYDQARQTLERLNYVAVGTGRDTASSYLLRQHMPDGMWMVYDTEGTLGEIRNMGLAPDINKMNYVGTFNTKGAAVNAVMQTIRQRENANNPPLPPKRKKEKPPKDDIRQVPEEAKEKPEQKIQAPKADEAIEELIGNRKINWYKRAKNK